MFNIFLTSGGTEGDSGWMTWLLIGLLVVMVIAMVVVPMFTRNKKQKEADESKKFLRPGDKIKTVGGIVGTIVEVNNISETEKELVIETGIGDRKTTMTIDVNALYIIMQRGADSLAAIEQARQEKAAAEAARLAEKDAKKSGGYNRDAGAQPQVKVFEEETSASSGQTVETAEVQSDDVSTKDE